MVYRKLETNGYYNIAPKLYLL